MYEVVIHRRAVRYLQRLPPDQQTRVKRILHEIGNNPLYLPGIKHMVGDWSGYKRVRVGSTRVIFCIDELKKIVYVDHIGPRGDVYKGSA